MLKDDIFRVSILNFLTCNNNNTVGLNAYEFVKRGRKLHFVTDHTRIPFKILIWNVRFYCTDESNTNHILL